MSVRERPILGDKLPVEAGAQAGGRSVSSLSDINPEVSLELSSKIGDRSVDWGG